MIDFTLAEILTGLDLELTDHAEYKPVTVKSSVGEKPVSPTDEASVEKDEAEADRPKR